MAEKKKHDNVWTTERINELFRLMNDEGLDYKDVENPFHEGDTELRTKNLTWEYTPEEIRELKKCASDVTHFAKYCRVMQDTGLEYIKLREYQTTLLKEYQSNRFNILLAPRQVGKSIASAIFLLWYLLFNHDKNAMLLANVGSTSEELMDKIKEMVKGLPFYMKPGMVVNNVMSMRFDNGCRVLAKTTTKTTGIGFTIHFLYMDEFAHINENFMEAFFRSTYPTVSSSKVSRIIITSTPNGLNKFWEIYQGALEGKNSFNPLRVDYWQVPGRDDEWKKTEIANLGSEELFNQEYGNQFLSSSSLLLGAKELERIRRNEAEYIWKEIDCLNDSSVNYENLIWHPNFDLDSCNVPGKRYVLSVDLSEGKKGDFSVINIFKVVPLPKIIIENMDEYNDESDFFGLLQVGIYRDNEAKLEDIAKILENLVVNVFGIDQVKMAVEVNFKGDLLIDLLLKNEDLYQELFLYTKHSESAKKKKPGIRYTNDKIKKKYCETLRLKIKNGVVMINEKKWTIPELFAFGQSDRGTYASQSGHDDAVMTAVNLSGFFLENDFIELIGEVYDSLEGPYRDLIDKKMNGNLSGDSSPSPFQKFIPKTKDGGIMKSFNDLL